MDDRKFSGADAEDWIKVIEGHPSSPRDHDIYPMLRDWIQRIAPGEVLEIGCGQGVCSEKIDSREWRYTGLDPNEFLLNRAKELYGAGNRKFVLANAYDIPFEAEIFDAAFSIAVW